MPDGTRAAVAIDPLAAPHGLPRSEALALLAHASGLPRERLVAGTHAPLSEVARSTFAALVARRVAGEPIAYLVGRREFFGRPFAVDARVLIPRPETELLVDLALAWIDRHRVDRVLDLGTGSGALAVTLALERPAIDVVATDRDPDALACARRNAAALGARVRFHGGDWFDAVDVEARFDLVVANPPYVAADDPHLGLGDLRFEPVAALTDGADGLSALRRIVAGAPAFLVATGLLLVEHGHDQAAVVRRLFADAGFDEIASTRDLAGIERVTRGRVRR